MYRKTYGKGYKGSGACAPAPPKGLTRSRKHEKKGRRPGPSLCKKYGPPKKGDRRERDKKHLLRIFSKFVGVIMTREKEKEEEEEATRIPEKEAEELPQLTVKKVNFHLREKKCEGSEPKMQGNAKKHHTSKFHCCTKEKEAKPVFRRGQEFKVTITFDRPYDKKNDDLVFTLKADDDSPGKNLMTNFKLDEERGKSFKGSQHWAARILKINPKKNALKIAIYIPADCIVGEWEFKVETALMGKEEKVAYVHPQDLVVLFNPWCKDDQVFYPGDLKDLQEYVLNEEGVAYRGCANYVSASPWSYGQFDADILQISLTILRQAFSFKMSSRMNDPVQVSRSLSKIINSSDDSGVLVGNWSGNYEGGTSPTKWKSSAAILREYDRTGQPVQYGQCWVFSHLLTAVCRALGLPCRSITNFDSAHDTDNSCTIDCYYNQEGEEIKSMKHDSIWNFHVWNEVWIRRPDIEEHDCNGWHVIDATPQEQSDGAYQCGPSPLKAIKEGLVNVGFDTGFIFGEVNADVVHWVETDAGDFIPSAHKKKCVGSRISSKPPDGKPFLKALNFFNMDDPTLRLDLTNDYKYQEGTEEERRAVKRAVRFTSRGGELFTDNAALEVRFDRTVQTMLGQDMALKAFVKNVTQEDKEVEILMTCRSCSYWNDSDVDKELCQEKPAPKTIRAGCEEEMQMIVPFDLCSKECDESMNVYAYVRAMDIKAGMPYSAQEPFCFQTPDLQFEAPCEAKCKETVTVKMTFDNPLKVPLTDCYISMEGQLHVAPGDTNVMEEFFGMYLLKLSDIERNGKMQATFQLCWEDDEEENAESDEESDEEGEEEDTEPEPEVFKTQSFEFQCEQIYSIKGSFSIKICTH